MKKIFVLFLFFIFSNSYSNYSTPGTGISWTLDSLVAYSGGNVTFSAGSYMVNDSIIISVSDTLKILSNSTLKFSSQVFIDIFGTMIMNPPDSVKITAQDTIQKFLGLKFEDLSDASIVRKLIFEYGNAIRLLDCNILIDNCIIRYNTLNSAFASSAINLFRSNAIISNNKIFRNRRSAIGSGANIASSPIIINNLIYENNTENANVPQINFGATGPSPMIIRGNTIRGLFDNAGGISFLPVGSIPNAIIENNIIKHNRYGIAIAGGNSNIYINNNLIDSNNIQGNPLLGGSGINFNGTATQRSIVTRNIIRGNLWGITIQGTAKPNMGDLSNSDTTDVGFNRIYSNGNSGKIFDLYNNTPDSIKAENNFWGTIHIDTVEAHIFHKPDSAILGFVDYLPINTDSTAAIKVNVKVLIEGMYDPVLNLLTRTDVVTVYLRDALSHYSLVDSSTSEIDSITFTGLFTFNNAPSSIYYIVAKHFNSIETWSKTGGELLVSNNSIYSYDFTNSITQAYGNNLKPKGNKFTIYSGDVSRDGYIDASDISPIDNDVFMGTFGTNLPTDLNADDFVDSSDVSIVENNLGIGVISPLNP